jgi:diketogulonate reductase-like aldo/keto reductase
MEKLGLDVLDLYLIHWPLPSRDKYVDTWKALVQLKEDGRIRSIGVSNFQPAHLRRLLDEVGVVPSVNQVELHPFLQQGPLRAVHAEHGIATEAWSPLAQGKVLDAPVLTRIAAEHDKTAAQVVLRWHVDLGNVVIPKSVTPSRMAENLDIFDFSLSDAELAAVAGIDRAERIGFDPDTMDIG